MRCFRRLSAGEAGLLWGNFLEGESWVVVVVQWSRGLEKLLPANKDEHRLSSILLDCEITAAQMVPLFILKCFDGS